MKTFKTVAEVESARQENKSVVFNLKAALNALKTTPATAGRRSGYERNTEFGSEIRQLFDEAAKNDAHTLNKVQLGNMYAAAKSIKLDKMTKDEQAKFYKKIYEHCLAKSDQPSKKNANPVYHYENGAFSIKK